MRLYKEVKVVQRSDGYTIKLDSRLACTPRGKPLVLASKALARAIANEWRVQQKIVVPSTMPLCGHANTAIDRICKNRQIIYKKVLNFAETDLLCYRVDEPKELATRQNEYWQPILNWASDVLGVKLEVTIGVVHVKQPAEAIDALATKLQKLNDMELAGIASLTTACGSAILAFAIAEGRIDAKRAFECSQLDQTYQNERWGIDEEAKASQKVLENEIASAALFLSLLESSI